MERTLYVVMVRVATDLMFCEGVFDSRAKASSHAATIDPTGKTFKIHRTVLNPTISST